MADFHNVPMRSIGRCATAAAADYVHCQLVVVEHLARLLEALPPIFAIVHQMWDETGERLSVRVLEVSGCRVDNSVDAFVSRAVVTLGLEGRRRR